MIGITIVGGSGRMGRVITRAVEASPEFELMASVARTGSDAIGRDAGELAGAGRMRVALTDDLSSAVARADVVLDFSTPDTTDGVVTACCKHGTPLVIGTTGLGDEQHSHIESAADDIPLIVAPNTSVGVNVLFDAVRRVAAALGGEFDAEIFEAHHRYKADAPSGTAIRLGEVIAGARGRSLADVAVYAREGRTGERRPDEIGFSTMRGGGIAGEHTVCFAGGGERLELTHRAASRDLFGEGALRAARWLAGRAPGLYTMSDVLGLSDQGP